MQAAFASHEQSPATRSLMCCGSLRLQRLVSMNRVGISWRIIGTILSSPDYWYSTKRNSLTDGDSKRRVTTKHHLWRSWGIASSQYIKRRAISMRRYCWGYSISACEYGDHQKRSQTGEAETRFGGENKPWARRGEGSGWRRMVWLWTVEIIGIFPISKFWLANLMQCVLDIDCSKTIVAVKCCLSLRVLSAVSGIWAA